MTLRLLACAGAMLVASQGVSAQVLVYEREYTMIAEASNTLRAELSADDRMLIERPAFMTRPGRHEIQAPPGTFQRFLQAFEAADTDSQQLYLDLQRRAAEERVVVTDPEYSRFALVEPGRGPVAEVAAVSLEGWVQRIRDPRLERLYAFEREWFRLMDLLLAIDGEPAQ